MTEDSMPYAKPLPESKPNRLRLAVLIVLCAMSSPLLAQDKPEQQRVSEGEIGRRIADFAERSESAGFSGAILAARKGKVVAAVGVGSADLEGKIPNTPATLFEIASATKQFTAAAMLRLVQHGRVKLDDSIAVYLPGVPASCKAITVRHLLQHTSGIPGSNSAGGGDDISKVLPLFLRGGPKHPPGTHWEYWNQGYALATEIIARASDKNFTVYCKDDLFAPAGLRATCFTGDRAPDSSVVAIGRSVRGQPRSALDHPYGTYGFQYRGMGGVVTSVWDLWRWDRALQGDSVLGEATKATLFEPGLNNYALGWSVQTDSHGRLVQSHGGGVRGFVCELRRYPNEDGCLFVLSNRDDVPVQTIASAIEALLFGEPLPCKAPPRPLDAALARAIAGKYQDSKGAKLVVENDGKVARIQIHWGPPRGPVTRAVLGVDAQGEIVLYEWSDATKTEIVRKGAEPASRVSILDRQFDRVR
jgi:CubicO group peptidase (beta-lactamase class C family)